MKSENRLDSLQILRLVFLLGMLFGATVIAQESAPKVSDLLADQPKEDKADASKPSLQGPADEFNRGTPRGSLQGLGAAYLDGDYETAVNFLDLRNLPDEVTDDGPTLARKLRIVARQTIWVDIENTSDDPLGFSDDGLPSYRDLIGQIPVPDGTVDLLLQRVPRDDGVFIWKVSNASVAQIPSLYEHYGYGEIGDTLNAFLPDIVILGLETWQWTMLLGILGAALIFAWVLTFLMIRFLPLGDGPKAERLQHFIRYPVRFLIITVLARLWFDQIGPSLALQAIFQAKTLYIIALTWTMMGVVDLGIGRLSDRMKRVGRIQATVLLRPAITGIKVVLILLAAIVWLDNLGFRVTTLLAGLGVGSVAIALAAQKSIENLIGAITLYASQPIRVGDFCRFGNTIGTVEEINLRSTRIRTLNRSLVSVPNGVLVGIEIENITKRDKILYRSTLSIRADATADQLRFILVEIRKILYGHPRVDPEPARTRFREFGEDALKLEIFAYIRTTDWDEYLAVVEDLNLRFLDVVGEAGTQLAVKARTLLTQPSDDAGAAAEARVAEWRERRELLLPNFPDQTRDEIGDKLDYPPAGSALKRE